MHGNPLLLTDVLKGAWLDGLLIGDWNGHAQLAEVRPTPLAVNAGIDTPWSGWLAWLFHNTLTQPGSGGLLPPGSMRLCGAFCE